MNNKLFKINFMKKSTTKLMTLVIMFMLCVLSVNATTYYSTGSVAANTLTNWKTARDGTGTSPGNFTTGDVFIVQGTGGGSGAPHSMTTSSTLSISGTGSKLWIESGATLTATSAITLAAATTFQIDNGGTYVHGHTGAISNMLAGTESFGTSSNFVITGGLGTGPTKASITGGSFGNFTFTGTATMQCNGVFPDVTGTLTCNSVANEFRMAASVVGNGGFSVGNFVLSSGIFSFGNGTAVNNLTVTGDFTISGGTFQTACSTNPSTNTVTFTKSGVSTFTKSGGTITAASSSGRHINFIVSSGTTLNMGTNILDCAGSTNADFTVNSGGTVRLGDPGGIVLQGSSATTGNIRTSSTSIRSFSTGANYEFTGGAAQITGTGLPATVNNLTINNTLGGVTLTAATTVNGILAMTNGILTTTGTNLLTLGSAATVSGGSSSSFVSGPMQHTIASTSSTAKTFPLGKGSAYAPVVLTVTQSAATSTTYKAEVFASGIPSRTLPGTISAVSTNRYYALSSSGSIISNGSIGLVYDANDAGISTGTAAAMRIVNDQGGAAWVDQGPVAGGSSPITSGTNFTTLGNFAIANAPLGTPPTVSTEAVSSVASTTATGNGNITDQGSSNIILSGVCWSTNSGAEMYQVVILLMVLPEQLQGYLQVP